MISSIPKIDNRENYESLYYDIAQKRIARISIQAEQFPYGTEEPVDGEWPPNAQNRPSTPPENGNIYTNISNNIQYIYDNGRWIPLESGTEALPTGHTTLTYDQQTSGGVIRSVTFDGASTNIVQVVVDDKQLGITDDLTWNGDGTLTVANTGNYYVDITFTTAIDYTILTPIVGTPPGKLSVYVNGVASVLEHALTPQYACYDCHVFGVLTLKQGDVVSIMANGVLEPTPSVEISNLTVTVFGIAMGSGGIQGDPGPQGPQGLKGDTGEVGPQGIQGVKGDTGDMGPQGPKGDTGDVGPQGIQGIQGDKGDTGDVGPQGTNGPEGPQGPTLEILEFASLDDAAAAGYVAVEPLLYDTVSTKFLTAGLVVIQN